MYIYCIHLQKEKFSFRRKSKKVRGWMYWLSSKEYTVNQMRNSIHVSAIEWELRPFGCGECKSKVAYHNSNLLPEYKEFQVNRVTPMHGLLYAAYQFSLILSSLPGIYCGHSQLTARLIMHTGTYDSFYQGTSFRKHQAKLQWRHSSILLHGEIWTAK